MDPEEARKRLEAEKHRVTGLIREVSGELDDEVESGEEELSNYDQHPADSGTDTFEREKDLGILDDLEAELAEIEAAIERIENGTYGIDEVTGAPIDPDRLEAIPVARTNVDSERPPEE
jgi:RNA polymerase-binding transcription factor DksA